MAPNCIQVNEEKDTVMYRRTYFASKSIFVTPYNYKENYPVGDYTTESDNNDGLYKWTK